ncbi:5116_t:CDS:1, partial [Racocetra persica]
AEKQGYYVQNPNIYDQQRDSISSNPVGESSPVPHFHNYNIPRRESNSSISGQIYERSTSPAFNPRQYSSPTPPPIIRQVNQPPYMQQSSQQPYQQRSPRMHNVAGPQNSMSSPIVRPRHDINNPQQPPPDSYYQGVSVPIPNVSVQDSYKQSASVPLPKVPGQDSYYQGVSAQIPNVPGQDSYYQGVSAPILNVSGQDSYYQGVSATIPNVSGQYNYDPSHNYYNNQVPQRSMIGYGQAYYPGEDNEISQNNMYNPQDQMNARRYNNYN